MLRRTLLKRSAASAGAITIAGCIGGSSSGATQDGGTTSPQQNGTPTPQKEIPEEVTFIIPNSAGGGWDAILRTIISSLEEVSGKNFVPTNIGASGGVQAFNRVANRSPKDGREITNVAASDINEQLNLPGVNFDLRNFTHLAGNFQFWLGYVLAHQSSNIDSWDSFVEESKSRRVTITTLGPENPRNVLINQIKKDHGLSQLEILNSIDDNAKADQAMRRGELELYIGSNSGNVKAWVNEGIAHPAWGALPPDHETEEYDIRATHDVENTYYPLAVNFGVISGPPGMDQPVAEAYTSALDKALSPDKRPQLVDDFVESSGFELTYIPPEEMTQRINEVYDLYSEYMG